MQLCRCGASTGVVRSPVPSDLRTHPPTPACNPIADHFLGIYIRQDQYSLRRVVFQNLSCRVHAIQFWHASVQDKKIGFQSHALLHRILTVSSFTADLPAYVRSKQ
jgi:hypothetical protein